MRVTEPNHSPASPAVTAKKAEPVLAGKEEKPRSGETVEGSPAAMVITASEVLENLKKHDAIYESGFSVSGTMVEQFPFNADTGARCREERRWKFTHDGNRWGWKAR